MDQKQQLLLNKLLQTFKLEAEEHLNNMITFLVELEKENDENSKKTLIENIFREFHSLKGASRTVNRLEAEKICHACENVFFLLKNNQLKLSSELFNQFHALLDLLGKVVVINDNEISDKDKSLSRDLLQKLNKSSNPQNQGISENKLANSEKNNSERNIPSSSDSNKKIEKNLQEEINNKTPQGKTSKNEVTEKENSAEEISKEQEKENIAEEKNEKKENKQKNNSEEDKKPKIENSKSNIRISTDRLNNVLLQIEELRGLAINSRDHLVFVKELGNVIELYKREINKNEHISNDTLASLGIKISSLIGFLDRDQRSFHSMLDSILGDMRKLLMLPCSSVLDLFPKIVRDLSQSLEKEVELIVQNGEIVLDRRILEEIKDPLIHIIRNCVDHGIEKPAVRIARKKPAKGTINISVSATLGNKIEISISDNGNGINLEKLKNKAIQSGLISYEHSLKMTEQEQIHLIFESGISTSDMITDLSGRGLGMAIVREKIEKLGGSIQVEMVQGKSTNFTIRVPTTLATFRGILVRVWNQLLVFPTVHVERAIRLAFSQIKTIENREVIQFNDQSVSAVSLAHVLNMELKQDSGVKIPDKVLFVVAELSGQNIAFQVDEILGEQDVIVKSMGKKLGKVPNISGVTILGSGKVIPILNMFDLMKSAITLSSKSSILNPEKTNAVTTKKKLVLVVDDSITSRTLLKNVLQAASYEVKTAVDGSEGLSLAKSEYFDLIISDIDMPNLDGFEMTRQIKSDEKLTKIPVILVTSRDTKESKEKGLEVGANAYIVKSSFDQSNLLEVVWGLLHD
ncbi:hybrid sensor histidine kinase/response regulator [Pigmentibacter sp. JX0631]|uniref:hybrid sensor histidine kinase/response regulator n=1 Tax=Pigmentibacter sp. JX0631 TaxID=2976982 RepID=UPI0024698F88|nr:hybrid sensor histidine kinase/response regulator [Pigmentibacter sp. JX0631]WGL61101.1 hybrid sensor histidine kinase/response regulator [Pigmentibacter sp. JX0631]